MSLQSRAFCWHKARFPEATAGEVVMKSMEELGELSGAVLAITCTSTAHADRAMDALGEAADLVVTALVLASRFLDEDLFAAVDRKLTMLETPGAHPASIQPEEFNGDHFFGYPPGHSGHDRHPEIPSPSGESWCFKHMTWEVPQ